MTKLSHGSVAQVFLWVYAAPVVSFWVMLSFLPLAGMLIDGATPLSIIGDVVFFLLGFGGLFSLNLLALYFAAGSEQRTLILGFMRGRVGLVSVYATVWLVGYWLFKYLVV
jgi:hypothetical protein